MAKHYLDLSDVGMRFATPNGWFEALVNVNLKIAKGEFISLIGHSGCGKSTVLNLVAGLNEPTSGGIILDGREVAGPGPERAVVFQNHALLPWLSVYENVELAVRQVMKGASKAQVAEKVRYYLSLVHMDHALEKKPHEISGGMKQRVGIARALSMSPKVLLMDEPFGALDALTRAHLQDALMEIQASRFAARLAPDGSPVLLMEQDRSRWDRLLIQRGLVLRLQRPLEGRSCLHALPVVGHGRWKLRRQLQVLCQVQGIGHGDVGGSEASGTQIWFVLQCSIHRPQPRQEPACVVRRHLWLQAVRRFEIAIAQYQRLRKGQRRIAHEQPVEIAAIGRVRRRHVQNARAVARG